MNSNETRALWISLAAGLFAAFLLYSYSQEKQAELTKKFGSSKRVVVASKDILEMETVDDTMLDTVERPVDFIEPNAVGEPESAVGKVAAATIKKGEQILSSKLLTPGPDTGLALQVSPGKRALPIPVDEVRGVAKLLRPGDRIDLIAAVDIGKGISLKREVQVLMQDIVILATGSRIANNIPRLLELDPTGKEAFYVPIKNDMAFTTVTIEVGPKEAQDIIYILSTAPGNLYMTLRNPNDRNLVKLASSTTETITGKPSVDTPRVPSSIPTAPVTPPPAAVPPPQEKPKGRFRNL